MNPFGGKGHIVYMDRFYTSLPVIRTLEEMKIGTVGTCMRNRLGLSEDLNKEIKKLGKGQFNYYERDNVMLTVYQDAKTVFLLSNIDQVKQTRVTRKIRKKELVPGSNKFTETVNIPSAIAKYNQQARGVDILDQYINYYMFPHKSLKWYFRIIIFLLEISLLNSWVLFTDTQQKRDEKTISFLSYRRKVGKDLIKDFTVLRGVSTTPLKKKSTNHQLKILSYGIGVIWGKALKESAVIVDYIRPVFVAKNVRFLCAQSLVMTCILIINQINYKFML